MDYDLCVIGAGWAGFNAAVSAAKRGKKVCLVEAGELGGVCLNRGCIPTKAFVHFSKQHLPYSEIRQKKSDVVARLRQGMAFVAKSVGVDTLSGAARIESKTLVSVGENRVKTEFILIATGAVPRELPELKFDGRRIVSSDDALLWEEAPKKVLVIGAGAIGCEFACILKRLGSDVALVEIAPQLLPGVDAEVSRKLLGALQKQEIEVYPGKSYEGLDLNNYDKILVAVGRKPQIGGLWGNEVDIRLEKDAIAVDRELRTSVDNIFAVGDCIGGIMLAHVAQYEAELAVNNMFGKPLKRDYTVIPSSVFTSPEVGVVGLREEEIRASGIDPEVRRANFLSIGMAHILEETQGFVKVLIERETGRILGAAIIGPQATELVNIFSIMMKNKMTLSGLKGTVFAHPSVSEIIAQLAGAST